MKQKIIITALPDGINNKNNACKVSVAVSLQVESSSKTNPRLSDFPDYLNWPDVLKKAEWTVLADGVKISAKVVSAAIDSALWKNLFTPSIKVKPYTPEPLEELPILSFPVKHIVDFVKKAVNAAGKSYSNSLPDTKFYFDNTAFRQISDFDIQGYPKKGREEVRPKQILVEKRLHSRLTERLRQNKFIPFKSQPDPSIDFAQAKYFHGVYGKKIRNSAPTLSPPDFEFHDILSVISNYPQLLKRLGLILDMEFSPPATINTLRIIPTGLTFNTSTAIVCPATECIKTATGFYARPLPDSIIDKGYLKVNTDAFTVYQLDADGAALKYTQQIDGLILKAARQILHAVNNDIPAKDIQQFGNETKSQEGLPSMRTAGLSIARNGMAEKLFSRLTRSKELFSKLLTAGSTPVSGFSAVNASFILPDEKLFADDIILGFRLDIQPEDKPGQWFSLHRRLNKYSYLNTAGNEVPIPNTEPDEGFLQISAVKEEYEEGAILKVPETIACWEGWSLSVPRPGNALNEPLISDTEVHTDKKKELEKYKTPGTAEFRLNVIPQIVKGSLPMLRFGKKYAVKIRTVDLAGNSVPIQSLPENQNECIRPDVKYMRYEPVDPPFLKPANKMKDGESAEVMVIRSKEGVSVQQFEEQNPDKNGPHSADAVRHVFPPKTSVEMATALGMFDFAMGEGNSAKAGMVYERIKAEKDKEFIPAGDLSKMEIISADAKTLEVSYLADPLAAGVSFFVSDNDPNPKLTNPSAFDHMVSFYFDSPETAQTQKPDFDTWMKPRTFRIRLTESADNLPKIEWIASERTLKISLQKGVMLKLNYSCFWRTEDLQKYSGLLDMLGISNLSDKIGQHIAKGQHWMFSPWRTLTLVHAVQQPIREFGGKKFPAIQEILPDRNFGDNFALLGTKLVVHGPSTGQLDMEAEWEDWDDDITQPKAVRVAKRGKVFQFSTLYPVFEYVFGDTSEVKNNPFPAIKHMLNDTKHRRIRYRTIATTRYKENFFNLIDEKKEAFKITTEEQTEKGYEVIIPSSARPAAPEVAYVIPFFEWETKKESPSKTVRARGSGLRIYLKRPWYSSGDDERLAVVLGIPNINFAASSVGSFNVPVTTWGNDPTKLSGPLPSQMYISKDHILGLHNAIVTDYNLTTAEHPEARVAAVAFAPKFDEERQLYFVDVMLNHHLAYFPFVRLALARYQHHSVRKNGKDCCLSPIVQADYIQIPAPRASSLEFKSGKSHIVVAVTGTAPNIPGPNQSYFRNMIEIIIEPLTISSVNQIHVSTDEKPVETYSYTLNERDIQNFVFYHSKEFKLKYDKPYRIKILEYEVMDADNTKKNLPAVASIQRKQRRLIFSDVYEVT